LHLYSNEDETVLSPFGGIGSEVCAAIKWIEKHINWVKRILFRNKRKES
jgi:hypothetical protein